MADFTLSDMPTTLSRIDTAGFVDGASTAPFGGIGGVVPRSNGSVYIKSGVATFSVFDSGTGTYKTIAIPGITAKYGEGDPPDLCRIVTLPVLGTRAIIWHAGSIGIYAASPPAWATPNAIQRVPQIRTADDSLTYLNGGALFVPNGGAGAGDCGLNPFPIPPYISDPFLGAGNGFATWANMPWYGATWMFADPTGGDIGGLPYPYSIAPWVEAGYGDEYQGSIPTAMLTFSQPTATAPTIDVQDLAAALPFGFHFPAITVTVPSTATTGGLVLTDDPAFVGTPDPFGNVDCLVEVYQYGSSTPIRTDSFALAGLTAGPDVVRQYIAVSGVTYLVKAYYRFSYGAVVMYDLRDMVTTVVVP